MTNITHEERLKFIGASEIASLFYAAVKADGSVFYPHMFEKLPAGTQVLGCVSRHTTGYRLWQIKAGNIEADNLDDVERVRAGQFMESAIAAWAKDEWPEDFGNLQKVHRYTESNTVPGLGASRDYELKAAGMPPVEIKNVDYLVFRDQWNVDDDGNIMGPPMDITLQVQHQIAAENGRASHGWAVACVGGNSIKRGRIEAHAPTIAKIEEAVKAFWVSIAANEPPVEFADVETVNELYISGEATKEVKDLTGDNMLPTLCARAARLKSFRKRIELLENRNKAQIALRIGDHTKAKYATGTISFPIVNRKATTREVKASTYRGAMTIKETA